MKGQHQQTGQQQQGRRVRRGAEARTGSATSLPITRASHARSPRRHTRNEWRRHARCAVVLAWTPRIAHFFYLTGCAVPGAAALVASAADGAGTPRIELLLPPIEDADLMWSVVRAPAHTRTGAH
jgi:hypothetical protein